MKWPITTMGEHFRVKHGFAFKGEHFDSDGPYVLLTPGSFNEEGGYRDQGKKTKFYTGDVPDGYILDEGDLLVAMTEQTPGLLGSSAWIPEGGRLLHNQRLGRIVDLDERRLNRRFLYYLFNTKPVRDQISATATGGKVRHTAPERISNVRFQRPPLGAQEAIAAALSAYDDLIANNRRRLTLLEDAARQLYHEWFIRFRFPGHEHTRITNGLPDGWDSKRLGELVEIKKGKNITRETVAEGRVPVVAGGLEPAYFHNAANAKGPVVTISASGANAGYVNIYLQDVWASDCSFISAEWTRDVYYFYCLLKHRQDELFALQKGAAQPHVYPKDLQRLGATNPPPRLLRYFVEAVDASFALMANLTVQNRQLRAARDLLLPRLMSGEIAV
jgi:type I restriction enzyme, S subunit